MRKRLVMYRKSICITLGVVAALTSFAMTDFSSVAKEKDSIGDAVVKVVNPKDALCEEELSQDDIAGYVSCEQNHLLPEKKTTSLRIQELDDEENPEEEPVEEPEDKLIASGTMGNGFSWEIKNDVLTVQGLGEMPAMEEEGSPWISYSNQINAIVIGEGVKTISAKSFMGLDHATQLTVLGDVTKVGDFAFCQCRKLEKAEFTSALKEVGYAAFAECEALVVFSADSLSKVGEFAFQQVALTEFVISKDLEELPNNCFTASELRSYVVEAGNPQYQAIDGVLYSKDGKTLLAFPCYGEGNVTEASYRVEDGCNAIDAYAFMHNRTIENIDFNEVTTLGEAAFLDSFLTGALSIPDCITVLDGKFTFNASKRITSVHFGSGLKATVYSMFEDCTGIEDIDFGNTLTDLAMRTFKGCNSLTEITLPDRMTKWDGSVFNSCENLVTFRSKNLQEITYADFAQDYKLENVILGNVKMIYRQAFTNCPSLVRIDLPKTVTFVDENAFSKNVVVNCENKELVPFGNNGLHYGEMIEVQGKRDYTKAFQVLSIVNEQRKIAGLEPLKMDESLLETAMVRALEGGILFSHTRPDGSSCFSINDKMCAENIAIGQESAEAVMDSWMRSQGHKDNILLASANTIGIGCVKAGDTYVWVQVFSTNSISYDCDVPDNTEVAQKIGIARDRFSEAATTAGIIFGTLDSYEYTVYAIANKQAIYCGEKATIGLYIENPGFQSCVVPVRNAVWKSENSKIATVSAKGEIVGVSKGETNIVGSTKYFSDKEKMKIVEKSTSGSASVGTTEAQKPVKVTKNSIKNARPVLLSLKKSGKTKIKIKIQKVTGITGYQIKYADNKSFKKSKSLKIKKTSKTITRPKKGKKCYVKVRCYIKTKNGYSYSKWSKVVSK